MKVFLVVVPNLSSGTLTTCPAHRRCSTFAVWTMDGIPSSLGVFKLLCWCHYRWSPVHSQTRLRCCVASLKAIKSFLAEWFLKYKCYAFPKRYIGNWTIPNDATDCISICSRYNVKNNPLHLSSSIQLQQLEQLHSQSSIATPADCYTINIHLLPSKRHEAVSLIKSSIIPFLTLIPSLHATASDFNLNNTTTK